MEENAGDGDNVFNATENRSFMNSNQNEKILQTETYSDHRTPNQLECQQSEELKKYIKFSAALPQIIAACAVNMLVIQAGVNMSYSAILLPQLNETNSIIHIDKSESGWIAGLSTIFLPFGSFIVGDMMDRFGRRETARFTCIPIFISWILMYFAKNIIHIYIARIIAGISAGLTTVSLIYSVYLVCFLIGIQLLQFLAVSLYSHSSQWFAYLNHRIGWPHFKKIAPTTLKPHYVGFINRKGDVNTKWKLFNIM